jgi:hypothetical protein
MDTMDTLANRIRRTTLIAIISGLSILTAAPASADAPTIGETAPPLRIAEWLEGEPIVLSGQKGKVIVIDFWVSWYSPCLLAVPGRSEMQMRFADEGVIFLGVTNEPAWQVRGALHPYPDDLHWLIACDDGDRTFETYLQVRDFPTVPFTVIVDRAGQVAWMGDPRTGMEEVLDHVMAGTWDLDLARLKSENGKRLPAFKDRISTAIEAEECDCDALLELGTELAGLELTVADRKMRAISLQHVAWALLSNKACEGRYLDAALPLARQAYEECAGSGAYWYSRTLARALFEAGDPDSAIEYQMMAVKLVRTPSIREQLEADLDRYIAARAEARGEPVAKPEPPADTAADAERPTPAEGAEEAGGPLPPPAQVTAEQAIADLQHLHRLLNRSYCGYPEIQWKLQCSAEDWDTRTERYAEQLADRDQWPTTDLLELLAAYLAPVDDVHFHLRLDDGDERTPPITKRFYNDYTAYFSDLRLRDVDGAPTVIRAGDDQAELIGTRLADIPVAAVDTASLDEPLLFPTVPEQKGAEEYLLGVFSESKPDALHDQSFMKRDGSTISATLPIHRGRALKRDAQKCPPWELVSPPEAPLPTLRVRTAVVDELGVGPAPTGSVLRSEPAVVLDLRGNLGGSDKVANDWCARFSPQMYRYPGNAMYGGGGFSTAFVGGSFPLEADEAENEPAAPYAGRLFVLVDRNVASSGETFTAKAMQIPNAVLLGENTRGCVTHGNADKRQALPHSRIEVRFGWTRYNYVYVRPIREGVGFFPEYWLDDEDAYEAIRRLLDGDEQPAPSRSPTSPHR